MHSYNVAGMLLLLLLHVHALVLPEMANAELACARFSQSHWNMQEPMQ